MKSDLEGRAIKLSLGDPPKVTFRKTLPLGSGFAPTRTVCATIHDVMLRKVRSHEKQVVARAATWGLTAYDDRATGLVLLRAANRKQSLEDILTGEITVLVDLEDPLRDIPGKRDRSRFPHQLGIARASLIKPWVRTFDEAKAAADGYFSMTGDWGGVTYILGPMAGVWCSERTLRGLHVDLETILGDESEGRALHFSSRGTDRAWCRAFGIRARDWHPKRLRFDYVVRELGLVDRTREVLQGIRTRLGSEEELRAWRRTVERSVGRKLLEMAARSSSPRWRL